MDTVVDALMSALVYIILNALLNTPVNALFECSIEEQTFAKTMHQVVRAGGDTDTNGAVAGALVGALVGFAGLPREWVAELSYGVWLEAWVQKLLWMIQLPVAATSKPALASCCPWQLVQFARKTRRALYEF